jgi:hypothetical protein
VKLRHAATFFALLGWFLSMALNTWAAQPGPRQISDLEFFIGDWRIVQGEGVDFAGKAFQLNGRYSIDAQLTERGLRLAATFRVRSFENIGVTTPPTGCFCVSRFRATAGFRF